MPESVFLPLEPCTLHLRSPGTYQLTYTVSFPAMREMDGTFFLKRDGDILDTSKRRVQKRAGYRLTILEQRLYDLPEESIIQVDTDFKSAPGSHFPALRCSLSARKI